MNSPIETTTHQTADLVVPAGRASVVLSAVLAFSFGVFLVIGAGFANPTAIHNAAHDVRHATALPCH